MTLHTRIEKNVIGYNGINVYDENDNFLGDIIWKETKTGKIKVALNIQGFKAVPKAIDPRDDDKYDFDDEDCID